MNSDDYVHGINKMKRPATKVMAPPGGRTNINLFGGDSAPEPHTVNKHQAHRNQSSIIYGEEKSAAAPTSAAVPAPTSAPTQPTASTSASAAQQNVPADSTAEAPGGGRPSTKVMAPPGGKTSINLFG